MTEGRVNSEVRRQGEEVKSSKLQGFGKSSRANIWLHHHQHNLHMQSPDRYSLTPTKLLQSSAQIAQLPRFDCPNSPKCWAHSVKCSPGSSLPKSSTSRSSSAPRSCSGKGSPSSPTPPHQSSSFSPEVWSPRSNEGTCSFYGIEA